MVEDYYEWEITLDFQASFVSSNQKNNVTKWWSHKKGCLKLIRSFERISQELFMLEFQHQNSTKWWCHQWIELNLLKSRSFLGIIPKVSQANFHHIRITKSKVVHVQIPIPMEKKPKKWGGKNWIIKWGNKEITNRDRF